MKVLILGTCFVGDTAQKYGIKMVEMWCALARDLNPDTNILMVDSASPIDLSGPISQSGGKLFRFDDNAGHLNWNGVDGWGRSLSKGLQTAIAEGYDYVAYIDGDIIFTKPVDPIVEKMARSGVKAAVPMDGMYSFLENGIMFLDVGYVRDTDLIGRYDWQSRKRTPDPLQIPEVVFEKLLDDVLFTLPLRGVRDDLNRLTVNNLEHMFPYGLDYLTHCRDFAVYERLLKMKGIEL